ncbi:MAG TPA: hypothetical protein VMX38_11870 [Verrucomicrobiae bacterium]|jgi:hypothetical protein|nr:hypothetical protein [Verrucomicrobiae bacterium]
MTIAIILVVLAAVSLAVILRVSVKALEVSATGSPWKIQPLDIEAFRNLTDPAEEAYLRKRLPVGDYRRVRRERLRATSAYVQVAGRNAGVLIQLGQMALVSSNASTAEPARQLVDQALLLRRNCAFALIRIHVALVLPFRGESVVPVLRGYEQVNGSAQLLTRLQNPVAPLRISS